VIRRGAFGTVCLIVSLLLAACVAAEQLPATCSQASVSLEATVTAKAMQPQKIDVCQGQEVHLSVHSEASGELHFHGYDEEIPEQQIAAGDSVDVSFTAVRAGQFPIELHPENGGEEIHLGALVVHQR
jgi:uncharacterized protein YcfL